MILTGTARSHGRSRPDTIDLGDEEIGKLVPFPVISMPVLFSAHGPKNLSKQEKVERMYLVPLRGGIDSEIGSGAALLRFTEQTSFDLDKVSVNELFFYFLMSYRLFSENMG